MLDQISKARLAAIDHARARLRTDVADLCRSMEPRDVATGLLFTACDVLLRDGMDKDSVVKHLRWFATKMDNATLQPLFQPSEITLSTK